MKQIPKIKLVPVPETEDGKIALGYQWNEEAGTRHFLGGPSPSRKYPSCGSCGEQMTFYAQIDSIGDNYDLADCGVIQTFVCFDCFTVISQLSRG